jgi:hypothetical protein
MTHSKIRSHNENTVLDAKFLHLKNTVLNGVLAPTELEVTA